MRLWFAAIIVVSASLLFAQEPATQPAVEGVKVPLKIEGGHDLDQRDGGRPVVLIAAALNVPEQVFRDVFKNVRPAHGRGPSKEEARANKKVLLDGLAKYGVTNERLDEVSNYYRYKPQDGGLWRHTPAAGYAMVKDGVVTAVTMTEPGRGYTTPPTITADGATTKLTATLVLGTDLAQNGSIKSVEIAK
ncbi:MAG TPA: hypothetical protein VGB55_14125 [Tepidisphaeraceae bacterium]|jgi:hypothetical protein